MRPITAMIAGIICGIFGPVAGASADCTIDPSRFHFEYPPNVIEARNQFFMIECAKRGDLVDATDPTLAGRLDPPKKLRLIRKRRDYYPDSAKRRLQQGTSIVAFVVEVDGSVLDVAIVGSSGFEDLDNAAISAYSEMRAEKPGMLNGRPVRLLIVLPLKWTLRRS